MNEGFTTINFFLLCLAGSARHDAFSDFPATVPIIQVLSRRHKTPFQIYALLECVAGNG